MDASSEAKYNAAWAISFGSANFPKGIVAIIAFLASVKIDIRYHDLRLFPCKQICSFFAYSRCATGDQGYLIFESHKNLFLEYENLVRRLPIYSYKKACHSDGTNHVMGYQEMFHAGEHLWHKNQGKHDAQAMEVPYKDGIRNIIFLTFSLDIKAEWVIWGK
jgi:hypothetical protein